MDVVSPSVRSRMMAGIRGGNTKPEMQVRRYLHGRGFRYRLFSKQLPGRPDLVLPRWGAVVFVHGCFWHKHQACAYFKVPKTRTDFWLSKIESNVSRDARTISALDNLGWRIAVVWECSLRERTDPSLRQLERFLRSKNRRIEI